MGRIIAIVPVILACITLYYRLEDKPIRVASVSPNTSPNDSIRRPIMVTVNELQDPTVQNDARRSPEEKHPDFNLHFIEFNDQGTLWNRAQFERTLHCIEQEGTAASAIQSECQPANLQRTSPNPPNATVAGSDLTQEALTSGTILLVYVHGWEHNCDVCDNDVTCFRDTLSVIARQETASAEIMSSAQQKVLPRRVIGVYVGWRGKSLLTPGIGRIDFWSREATAHRIGSGDGPEVFTRLESIKTSIMKHRGPDTQPSLLVYVGHSFGAALLEIAASPVLSARVSKALESGEPIQGLGDFTILINPALPAVDYQRFDIRLRQGNFNPDQEPVLMILASEADLPNKSLFPLGRFVELLSVDMDDPVNWSIALHSVGNYIPFRTHRLEPEPNSLGASIFHRRRPRATGDCRCDFDLDNYSEDIKEQIAKLTKEERTSVVQTNTNSSLQELQKETFKGRNELQQISPLQLRPLQYGQSTLEPSEPFLVVSVDRSIIDGHNDIFNPPLITFLIKWITMQDLKRDLKEHYHVTATHGASAITAPAKRP